MTAIIDKRRGNGAGSDAAQQATQRAMDTQVPDHIKSGVKISGITIKPTNGVKVPHKLGRAVVGWQVLRAVGVGPGSEVTEQSSDSNTITFVRPGGALPYTYDFWIF
jgi:hypothetical protein